MTATQVARLQAAHDRAVRAMRDLERAPMGTSMATAALKKWQAAEDKFTEALVAHMGERQSP